MGKNFFTMMMDDGLHRKLKLHAVENNTTMSSLVTKALGLVLNIKELAQEASKKEQAKEN
ncbi:hypothetical protein [Candidatus Kuenenia sp.]|uniref:hypothetical protein n=1 Tax=Candidatus Kuenenia sp. TaxID=2499824 RepID=UPI0032208FF2